MRIPDAALKWINRIMVPLLRSPLHGFVSSDLMLITVTGRRTGRSYTRPVSYRREGDTVRCFSALYTAWWKNLRGGADVTLQVRGEALRGRAHAHADDPKRIADALEAFLIAVPRDAAYYDVALDAAGRPVAADLDRASKSTVFVEIALEPEDR